MLSGAEALKKFPVRSQKRNVVCRFFFAHHGLHDDALRSVGTFYR